MRAAGSLSFDQTQRYDMDLNGTFEKVIVTPGDDAPL